MRSPRSTNPASHQQRGRQPRRTTLCTSAHRVRDGKPRAEAVDHIGGYTIANDFGIHDFRDTDAGSMLRVKGSDSLCPVGPGVVSDWDPAGKSIRTYVNGELRQDGNTSEMIWGFCYLVADLARTITLLARRSDSHQNPRQLPARGTRRCGRGGSRGHRHSYEYCDRRRQGRSDCGCPNHPVRRSALHRFRR